MHIPENIHSYIKRRAVYFQNVNSFSPYNVPFSGLKSAINIRQMYFMNPLKPTSRCEETTGGLNSLLLTSLNFSLVYTQERILKIWIESIH